MQPNISDAAALDARRSRRAQREAEARSKAAGLLAGDGLLRLPEVLAILQISRSAFYRGITEGRYAAPLRVGARTSAWRASWLRDHLARLEQESAA